MARHDANSQHPTAGEASLLIRDTPAAAVVAPADENAEEEVEEDGGIEKLAPVDSSLDHGFACEAKAQENSTETQLDLATWSSPLQEARDDGSHGASFVRSFLEGAKQTLSRDFLPFAQRITQNPKSVLQSAQFRELAPLLLISLLLLAILFLHTSTSPSPGLSFSPTKPSFFPFRPWFRRKRAEPTPLVPSDFEENATEAASRPLVSPACDLSRGRWIYDPQRYPLWTPGSCSLVEEGFVCARMGRLDDDYARFRWQPHDCNLKRFSSQEMRQLLRGKRVAFIGDSLARNQFESLLCLLSWDLPASATSNESLPSVVEVNGSHIGKGMALVVMEFVDFNFTVEYFLSHFVVAFHRPPAGFPKDVRGVVNTDLIDKTFSRSLFQPKWSKGRSLLAVFNMGHWFTPGKTRDMGFYFLSNGTIDLGLSFVDGFRLSVRRVARWIDSWTDPTATAVFRSYAPTHFMDGDWHTGGDCRDLHPFKDLSELHARNWRDELIVFHGIIKQELADSRALLLDVTPSTALRPDAHIAQYWEGKNGSDCSHWCLPGVPDIWNELLMNLVYGRKLG